MIEKNIPKTMGLSWVGLLSAILSKLYMQNYASINILNHKIYKQYIKAYFKNVDDTFILFKRTNRHAELIYSINIFLYGTNYPPFQHLFYV